MGSQTGEGPCFFPFGQPVRRVEQADRSPKRAFVLGVYASAVHARWTREGRQLVSALAVASEPTMFWQGDRAEAEAVIASVDVPPGCGSLESAGDRFNGPSGRALDDRYLTPLGLRRPDVWLCDLLPEARANPGQRAAVERVFPLLGLPLPTLCPVPAAGRFADDERRGEILEEFLTSQAEVLVTLGDIPLREFVHHHTGEAPTLAEHARNGYGVPRTISLGGQKCQLVALAHPRQAARLGSSSSKWGALHETWVNAQ
ncbi:MAG TPA: hypothetical protein VFW71_06195 [Actinomycetota bacterium]|nr:hypothetical protein [Actinomycetota bacterium]